MHSSTSPRPRSKPSKPSLAGTTALVVFTLALTAESVFVGNFLAGKQPRTVELQARPSFLALTAETGSAQLAEGILLAEQAAQPELPGHLANQATGAAPKQQF